MFVVTFGKRTDIIQMPQCTRGQGTGKGTVHVLYVVCLLVAEFPCVIVSNFSAAAQSSSVHKNNCRIPLSLHLPSQASNDRGDHDRTLINLCCSGCGAPEEIEWRTSIVVLLAGRRWYVDRIYNHLTPLLANTDQDPQSQSPR